jgi:hypothetical protein
MALPPQVIEQLGREPAPTPGWSGRLLMFTFTLFILSVIGYVGLAFGYAKYLDAEIRKIDREIKNQSQQIPEEEKGAILTFFSQLSNLRSILDKHVNASSVFNLLEATTHPKIYYTRLTLNSDRYEAVLTGIATSVSDVTEQAKIFQDRPEIKKVSLGNMNGVKDGWQFEINLGLAPEFLTSQSANIGNLPSAMSTSTSTSTSTPTSTLPQRR